MEKKKSTVLSFSEDKINKIINALRLNAMLKGLKENFVFRFSLKRILSLSYMENFYQLTRECLKFMLISIQSNSLLNLNDLLFSCSSKMKKYYVILVNEIPKENKSQEIDILLILICLCSRRFFEIILDTVHGNYEQELVKKQTTIQSYAYMILIHQTTGNMVSKLAFDCLRKKYIKKIIFKPNHQQDENYGLSRSLKHIEKQLSKKNLIVSRTEIDQESKGGRKKKFHQFLRSALKTQKQDQTEKIAVPIQDRVSSTFQELLKKNKIDQQQKKTKSVSRPKVKYFQELSKALKYHKKDRIEDKTDLFSTKYKSNSVHQKKPRHTLGGGKITIMKQKNKGKKLKKEIKKQNLKKDWSKVMKQMIEHKKDQLFSIEKICFPMYLPYHSDNSFTFDEFQIEKWKKKVQPISQTQAPQQEPKKQAEVEEIQIKNLQIKVANQEGYKKDKSLPKIKKTPLFFKKMKKSFEKQSIERDNELCSL